MSAVWASPVPNLLYFSHISIANGRFFLFLLSFPLLDFTEIS